MRKYFCLLFLLVAADLISCVNSAVVPEQKPRDSYTLKSGAKFKHPPTWTVKENQDYVSVLGPEPGFNVYILEEPRLKNSTEEAINLWRKIRPNFSYPVFIAQSIPKDRGFEAIESVVFDVPSPESKSIISIALSAKDKTYWLLIDATNELLSRRSAELMLIVESFRGANMPEEALLTKIPKPWSSAHQKEFHDFIYQAFHELKVPGATILVIDKSGKRIFQDALGVKDIEKNNPVTIDTPFMIGSVTKAFTTLMMAKLIDQNIITWQTKLKDVLTDFAVNNLELTNALDMRNSVSASTGMPRRDLEFIFTYKGVSAKQRLAELHFMAPTTKIGETFQYSNHLVMAGGYAAAHAYRKDLGYEQSYASAMTDLVFKPLGMKRTVINFKQAERLGNAFPHAKDIDGNLRRIPIDLEESIISMAPSGGIWSTAPDLARYIMLELNNGEIDGKPVIGRGPLLERRKPGAKMGESYHYGLGLFIQADRGLTLVGHDGNTIGFSSLLFFLPEQGIGLTILTNGAATNYFLQAVKQKFLELTFDAPKKTDTMLSFAVSSEKEWRDKQKSQLASDKNSVEWIRGWTGSYRNETLGDITIKEKKNGGFMFDCGEWQSDIASFTESNGNQSLFLTTPPFFFSFLPNYETKTLRLDAGQQKYEFK